MDESQNQPSTDETELTFEAAKPGPWRVAIGTVVIIEGVPLRVVNVNEGKRRLTLSPLESWPMCTVVSDPIVKVTKPRRTTA